MKLHEHFLKEDLYQASKEFNCFKDCLELTMIHAKNGDVELAKQRSIDVTKSLHELGKMAYKKTQVDRRNEMVRQLQQRGIDIQVVRGFFQQ